MYPPDFRGAATPLALADIIAEATALACPAALVHAFSDIESAGSGFLADGRPKILFEAHAFHKATGGQFDDEAPDLSSAGWDRSLYGAAGAHQYDRLGRAMQLDERAALESCSWGRYQLMGGNFHMALFASVDELVEAFCESEGAHVKAFGNFCVAGRLVRYLRAEPPDFVQLALGYNGPGERAQGYDQKLAAAYYHYVSEGEGLSPMAAEARSELPGMAPVVVPEGPRELKLGLVGEDVKALQSTLGVNADGIFGPATRQAVIEYQQEHGLAADGIAGAATKAAFGL